MEIFYDSIYIIKAAFDSQFFLSIFYTMPFLLFLSIFFIFLLTIISAILITFIENIGKEKIQNKNKRVVIPGIEILIWLIFILLFFLSLITFPISLSNLNKIEYKDKYLNKILDIETKNEIKKLKNENYLPLSQLQFGSNSKMDDLNRIETQLYIKFENNIIKQLKESKSTKTIYTKEIRQIYNPLFLKCLNNNKEFYGLNLKKDDKKTNIDKINILISKRKDECAQETTTNIIENHLFLK